MNPFEELRVMKNVDGDEVRFVKVVKDDLIQVWQRERDEKYICRGIKLLNHDIDIEELKTAGVFDLLNPKTQEEMGMSKVRVKEEVKEKMADMRGKRNHKYTNLPKELFCIECSEKIVPNYTQLQKKADKLMIPLVDMVKSLKCKKCEPIKRGRQSKDGKITKVELKCKCGNSVTYPSNMIKKMAEKKGISIDEMVKGYVCQTCNPTKLGRGRKPSGKVKQAKTWKCMKCGKEVTANWTYLNAKAKKMNVDVDELVKSFNCQICVPTKGRQKKEVV